MPKLRVLTESPPPERGTPEQQLRELRNYVARMSEELTYLLTHLETDNTGAGIWRDIDGEIPTPSNSNPVMDGVASPGSSPYWSRGDHRHGTDVSRASAAALDGHMADTANPHQVTKNQVGLGNVADVLQYSAENPPPTPTPAEVGAIPATDKGSAGGVAELDANGKVPSAQLPSYVDDVLEYASVSAFPATGESGKIYVAQDTNRTYRWSGSAYVEISASLALGETSSTAYRGDRGKTAYDHSQLTSGNPHNVSASDVGLGNVDNVRQYSASNPPPADAGKQDKITASGILKGDGNGGVSAAAAGTDYQTPLTAGTDYQTPLVAGTDYQTPLTAGTDYQTPLVAGTDYATPGMIPSVPAISTANPAMDGTAAPGSTGEVADAGHVHPTDTSRRQNEPVATSLYNGTINVSTNTNVTLDADYTGYMFLIMMFCTDNDDTTTRMEAVVPVHHMSLQPYVPLCNIYEWGAVRVLQVSGQNNVIKIHSTTFPTLYLRRVHGVK